MSPAGQFVTVNRGSPVPKLRKATEHDRFTRFIINILFTFSETDVMAVAAQMAKSKGDTAADLYLTYQITISS